MLNEEDYNVVKESFKESQRLFNKLGVVAQKVLDHYLVDEGLEDEDRERYDRNWHTLSRKIVDHLSEKLQGYSIELLKYSSLDETELKLNLIKDEEVTKIVVDYEEENELRITQLS